MKWLVYLIPILSVFSALMIYSKNGKREILKFDMVQFLYAFVLAPTVFVWFKSFLFFNLRDELNLYRAAGDLCESLKQVAPQLATCDVYNVNQSSASLSLTGMYVADTLFSVIFLFVYAFVVIHSMTKSMENKRYRDPLYDVFKHAEALHLWVSHVFIYLGVMVLLTMLSIVNIYFPLGIQLDKWQFYLVLWLAVILGVMSFGGIWLSIFKDKFWRLMKLFFGLFFMLHAGAYFMFDPEFNSRYLMYWLVLIWFTTLVVLAFFVERSNRAVGWFEKLHHKVGWSAKKKKYLLSK